MAPSSTLPMPTVPHASVPSLPPGASTQQQAPAPGFADARSLTHHLSPLAQTRDQKSMKERKESLKQRGKESGRESRGRCGVSFKNKIYFEPFQGLAGEAGRRHAGPAQAEGSCVSRNGRPGLPPSRPRGREHVRFDSVGSDIAAT